MYPLILQVTTFITLKSMFQPRVTLSLKPENLKQLSSKNLRLLVSNKTVTLPLDKLNHAQLSIRTPTPSRAFQAGQQMPGEYCAPRICTSALPIHHARTRLISASSMFAIFGTQPGATGSFLGCLPSHLKATVSQSRRSHTNL